MSDLAHVIERELLRPLLASRQFSETVINLGKHLGR